MLYMKLMGFDNLKKYVNSKYHKPNKPELTIKSIKSSKTIAEEDTINNCGP